MAVFGQNYNLYQGQNLAQQGMQGAADLTGTALAQGANLTGAAGNAASGLIQGAGNFGSGFLGTLGQFAAAPGQLLQMGMGLLKNKVAQSMGPVSQEKGGQIAANLNYLNYAK